MTVPELIAAWTPEERERFADLIVECRHREHFLNHLKADMRKSEEELQKSLSHLVVGINTLAFTVKCNLDQTQEIYLKLAEEKGNA